MLADLAIRGAAAGVRAAARHDANATQQADACPQPAKPAKLDPLPPGVTGAMVLDSARRFLDRFTWLPDEVADATVAWAVHTWAYQAFGYTPRIAFLSDQPGSGKSTMLKMLTMLARDGQKIVDPSAPAITRLIEQSQPPPTLLVDEVDNIFGRHGGSSHWALRAVLNEGFEAGATVPRKGPGSQNGDPKINVFAPVAFAGLGTLPPTLLDRSVVIRMEQKPAGTKRERFVTRVHKQLGVAVGEDLGRWAQSVAVELSTLFPDMPEEADNRVYDVWEPLMAVAEMAGGDWPLRIRRALLWIEFRISDSDAKPLIPIELRLCRDILGVWDGDSDRMPTADLLPRLFELDGAPWRGMWRNDYVAATELSAMLTPPPLNAGPVKIRIDAAQTRQGYYRHSIEDAVEALGGTLSAQPEQESVPDLPCSGCSDCSGVPADAGDTSPIPRIADDGTGWV